MINLDYFYLIIKKIYFHNIIVGIRSAALPLMLNKDNKAHKINSSFKMGERECVYINKCAAPTLSSSLNKKKEMKKKSPQLSCYKSPPKKKISGK